MTYTFFAQFVLVVIAQVFVIKVMTLVLSILSFIWLAAYQPRMESMSGCRCVQSVIQLMV
jgi:hypothetical protein